MIVGLASSILASPIIETSSAISARNAESADAGEFVYSAEYIESLENRPSVLELVNTTELAFGKLSSGNGTSVNTRHMKRQWTSGWSCSIWAGWGMSVYAFLRSPMSWTTRHGARLMRMCAFQETKLNQ